MSRARGEGGLVSIFGAPRKGGLINTIQHTSTCTYKPFITRGKDKRGVEPSSIADKPAMPASVVFRVGELHTHTRIYIHAYAHTTRKSKGLWEVRQIYADEEKVKKSTEGRKEEGKERKRDGGGVLSAE